MLHSMADIQIGYKYFCEDRNYNYCCYGARTLNVWLIFTVFPLNVHVGNTKGLGSQWSKWNSDKHKFRSTEISALMWQSNRKGSFSDDRGTLLLNSDEFRWRFRKHELLQRDRCRTDCCSSSTRWSTLIGLLARDTTASYKPKNKFCRLGIIFRWIWYLNKVNSCVFPSAII